MARLTLTHPDDWHLHLRDGEILVAVLPDTARRFARAIVMPNLKPPVTTTATPSPLMLLRVCCNSTCPTKNSRADAKPGNRPHRATRAASWRSTPNRFPAAAWAR